MLFLTKSDIRASRLRCLESIAAKDAGVKQSPPNLIRFHRKTITSTQ